MTTTHRRELVCQNEICKHAAVFEVQGMTDAVRSCARHLPWAVRKQTEGELTVSVKELSNQKGKSSTVR